MFYYDADKVYILEDSRYLHNRSLIMCTAQREMGVVGV